MQIVDAQVHAYERYWSRPIHAPAAPPSNPMNSRRRNTLDQRALKLVIGHGLKLTRRADFSTLDPLAAEHALFLYRGDRSAELPVRHGALARKTRRA